MSAFDSLRRGLGFADPEAKKKDEAKTLMERDYRALFRMPLGRRVFTHMLEDLYFFDPAITSEQGALKNYATLLVYRCGFKTTLDITNAILDSVPTEESNSNG